MSWKSRTSGSKWSRVAVLRRVRLQNVRNHDSLALELGPGVNALVGPNGVGKTSVLEAVHVALRGSSPRTRSLREVIRRGEQVLRVEVDIDYGDRVVSAATGYDRSGERRMTRDGAPLDDYTRWEAEVPVRVFLPDHLLLVKGGPRRRRRYADGLALAAKPGYREIQAEYEEALRQRNYLLRRGAGAAEQAAWESVLAERGLELNRLRAEVLQAFSPRFAAGFALLAPSEAAEARLVYRTNAAGLTAEEYRERLAEERPDDRNRGYTRLGPHRDDVRLFLGDRDLREFGSQGEQRTALLALLIGERRWLWEEAGRWPLLLLDDVMSELDHERRRALFSALEEGGQTLISTTTTDYFTSAELATMTVIRIGPGPGRPTTEQ